MHVWKSQLKASLYLKQRFISHCDSQLHQRRPTPLCTKFTSGRSERLGVGSGRVYLLFHISRFPPTNINTTSTHICNTRMSALASACPACNACSQRLNASRLPHPHLHLHCICKLIDWLFRRLGDTILSTIASSICSLERAQRPAKVIPLVLQCLSESQDDFASKGWETSSL
jgi:hypothetical protein